MGIEEDREEINATGVRGLLRQIMSRQDEGFIREFPGGWRGEIISERPLAGSGPYLHFRRGYEIRRYSNVSREDNSFTVYRAEL